MNRFYVVLVGTNPRSNKVLHKICLRVKKNYLFLPSRHF